MWKGRLTYANDHANVPKNMASGSTWEPRTIWTDERRSCALVVPAQSTATRLPPRRLASATA